MTSETVKVLVVHHTATKAPQGESETIREIQQVYDYQTGPAKGWPDVCYNFFVDPDGRVFEGRVGSLAGPVTADATGGNQGFSQLVCVLGDFTSEFPTPEATASLTTTLAWLASRSGLPLGPDATTSFESRGSNLWALGATIECNTVVGHRELSRTACPGDRFYPFVRDELPARVAAARAELGLDSGLPATGAVDTSPPASTSPTSTSPASTQVDRDTTASDAPPTSAPPTLVVDTGGEAAQQPTQPTYTIGNPDTLVTLKRGLGGVGVVMIATGLGWIIKRRNEQAQNRPPSP